MRNLEAKAQRVKACRRGPEWDYSYEILYGSNIIVRTNLAINSEWETHGTLNIPISIKPHSQLAGIIRLADIVELKQVGEYSLRVYRAIEPGDKQDSSIVVSGFAKFRIVSKLSVAAVGVRENFDNDLKLLEEATRNAIKNPASSNMQSEPNMKTVLPELNTESDASHGTRQ